MQKGLPSEKVAIRYESELVEHFRELMGVDPDIHWLAGTSTPHGISDGHVELEFDGRRFGFTPHYELKPTVPWLEDLKVRSLTWPPPLVIAPELSSRLLTECKRLEIAAIDLNGRCWLRAQGFLVERLALPGRSFTYELEPRNIFVGKSARIVRCLLTDRDRIWTQAEVVPRTQASSGLVSRIVHHLISQGFVEKLTPRTFRLRDWHALLNEWTESDRFSKRTRTTLYAGFLGGPEFLADRLQRWADEEHVPLAFTQWIAAWTRHPHTEPAVCSAYVSRPPEAATLERLGLRQVTEGGKLWLHVPDDEGVLSETQNRKGLRLVTDAQIYLDLQRTGLRGPDAAWALREWGGFCRP